MPIPRIREDRTKKGNRDGMSRKAHILRLWVTHSAAFCGDFMRYTAKSAHKITGGSFWSFVFMAHHLG